LRRPHLEVFGPLPPWDLAGETAPSSRIGSILPLPTSVAECLQVAPVVRAALRLWYDVIDRRGRLAALTAKRFLSEHLCPELQPVALVAFETASARPRFGLVLRAIGLSGQHGTTSVGAGC